MTNEKMIECNKNCENCPQTSYQCENIEYPFGYHCIRFDAFIEVAKAGITKLFFRGKNNKQN